MLDPKGRRWRRLTILYGWTIVLSLMLWQSNVSPYLIWLVRLAWVVNASSASLLVYLESDGDFWS